MGSLSSRVSFGSHLFSSYWPSPKLYQNSDSSRPISYPRQLSESRLFFTSTQKAIRSRCSAALRTCWQSPIKFLGYRNTLLFSTMTHTRTRRPKTEPLLASWSTKEKLPRSRNSPRNSPSIGWAACLTSDAYPVFSPTLTPSPI